MFGVLLTLQDGVWSFVQSLRCRTVCLTTQLLYMYSYTCRQSHFKGTHAFQTDQYDPSLGRGKLEKDPFVRVGSPDPQTVASLQAKGEEARSRFVNLHQ